MRFSFAGLSSEYCPRAAQKTDEAKFLERAKERLWADEAHMAVDVFFYLRELRQS